MKTAERRIIADRAQEKLEQLEKEIKSTLVAQPHEIGLPLDNDYASFHAYSHLRALNDQFKECRQEYESYADNEDLITLVGLDVHDSLREHYPDMTALSVIMPVQTTETFTFYTQEQESRTIYSIYMEQVQDFPFYCQLQSALDIFFVRVDVRGKPY